MSEDKEKRHFPMLWLMTLAVALAVAFAAVFEIDENVSARGQMIPGSRTQVIQAVDGGALIALRVREGDRVKAGQILAELEPDRARAGWRQAYAEVASKQIAIARVRAELASGQPQFTSEQQAWPEFIAVQKGIYAQRKRSLQQELQALDGALKLAQSELERHQRLYQSGDVGETEVMRAERQVIETQARVYAVRNKYLQDSQIELSRLQDELSTAQSKLDDRASVLSHTNLTAPTDGIVKVVRMNTVGGVLRSGDELMQISPVDGEVIAEIRINPVDVGQLRIGLPVAVRFDAFDSSVYGSVPGVLRYISSDTLSEKGPNDQLQVYYRAEVVLNTDHGARIRPGDIKPGMLVGVDIHTGTRTLLYYLAKPIVRAFSGALSDR